MGQTRKGDCRLAILLQAEYSYPQIRFVQILESLGEKHKDFCTSISSRLGSLAHVWQVVRAYNGVVSRGQFPAGIIVSDLLFDLGSTLSRPLKFLSHVAS